MKSADTPRAVRSIPNTMNYPNIPSSGAPPPGMNVGDIYYVLFRHKWRILLCTVLGMAASWAVYKLRPPPFQSEASLLIRYVAEAKTLEAPGDDVRMKSPDQRGETIINSELEILTSRDSAEQVAVAIGPEKLLAKAGGGKDLNQAAALVQHGMTVEAPHFSSVIHVAFQHPDSALVQPVLREIIDRYLKKHIEIHRASGIVGDFLTQETDALRAGLAQTEDELRKARNKAGVISVADAKKSYGDQIARIRQEILTAQADLAERSSVLDEIMKGSPPPAPKVEATPELAPELVAEYRRAGGNLEQLQKREQELLAQFTPESPRAREVRAQIVDADALKKKLETDHPALVRVAPPSKAPIAAASSSINVSDEAIRLTALQAKIKVLNAQLDAIRAEASGVDQMEGTISELQRKKDREEANYKFYAASQEQSRISEALGAGTVSNISQVQTPSPPFVDWSKTYKLMAGVAAAGVGAGLAWAFLIEFFLDRSVRRPIDVERILHLPLFLSIPRLGKKEQLSLAASTVAATNPTPDSGGAALVPREGLNALHSFHETLRDRLISYFESKNLTHKPKLVAVTGLGRGSGVTTTAAGLASSLSETGDGNVLLVDMTLGQGSAQQFYKGNAICGIDEVLDTRDNAQIEGNLYVVGEEPGGAKLTRILPQRFNKLVPKLKASNFDYIIFDMPPVNQISITPRLAGFMDMVLLVLESEKTDQDLVRRATLLLAESKAHVGAVLNKTKTYVPPRLHQEYLGNT